MNEQMNVSEILAEWKESVEQDKLNRASLDHLRDNKQLVGVEIGVSEGLNAVDMLDKLDIKNLYLVDPYKAFRQWTQEKLDGHLKTAKRTLAYYDELITWIREPSEYAVTKIPDLSLDFVYVDGNHEFVDVVKDIMFYWNKLKYGGLMCGDNLEYPETARGVSVTLDILSAAGSLGINRDCRTLDWWAFKLAKSEE